MNVDAANYDDLVKRSELNQQISGHGADTTMHSVCPFCGTGHFMCYPILETEKVMSRGAVCRECNRGAKCVFERDADGVTFKFIQTCGPDAPDWMPYRMQRLG